MKFSTILKYALCAGILINSSYALEQESEHPPLSEETKKAIAHYKRNPNENTKAALKAALTQSYDKVIALKKQKLKAYEQAKKEHVEKWLKLAKTGKSLPFLRNENNAKNTSQVREALKAYQSGYSQSDREALKKALNLYYDSFLEEQRAHIKETERLKDSRIEQRLAHFTDTNFTPHKMEQKNIDKDSVLIDIMRVHILKGAEFLPVNPEARVREREFNAKISAAQENYRSNPTSENKQKLINEVESALHAAYMARVKSVKNAMQSGLDGGKKLYAKLKDDDFIAAQIKELISQRNLYGRIDRLVSFGTQDYTPSHISDSKSLYNKLLNDEKAAKEAFNKSYLATLDELKNELERREGYLKSLAERISAELIK